ncbi:hypothetical protein WJ02_22600 [Burkholderia vietnamiensis]|nr:hypothetical protein WJ02_22600 [Burkholderia vietnamiensis]
MGSSRTRDKRREIRSLHVRPDAAARFAGTPAPDGPTRVARCACRRAPRPTFGTAAIRPHVATRMHAYAEFGGPRGAA